MLAEREDTLRALEDAFVDCARSGAGTVVVSGPPASGRTAVLEAFGRRVVAAGGLLLTAGAAATERNLPCAVLSQLCESAPGTDELSRLGAAAAGTVLPPGAAGTVLPPGAAGTVRSPGAAEGIANLPVARSLHRALRELASTRPVVIGVDDAHFADAGSQQALLYAVRRLRAAPVLLVLTHWQLPSPHPLLYAEFLSRSSARQLRLAPLSAAGVADVLAAEAGPRAVRFAPAYRAASGGNPLLLRALVEDGRSGAGRLPDLPVVGDEVRHAVTMALLRWDPALLELARGAVTLGAAATGALLGRLLDLPAETAHRGRQVLADAGLLGPDGTPLPAVAAAVLDGLSGARRAELHRVAARLRHDDGAPAGEVATHLVAAGQVADGWGRGVLRAAADQALAEDRADAAADCLDLVRDASCGRDRAAATSALARARWRSGPASVTPHLDELGQALRTGRLDRHDSAVLVGYLRWHGRLDEADDVLHVLAGRDPTEARDRGHAAAPEDVDRAVARHWLPSAPEAGPGQDVPRPASALAAVLAGGPHDGALADAERLLQTHALDEDTLEPLVAALATLSHGGRPLQAARWCDELAAEAADRGAVTWLAVLEGTRAGIGNRLGDLAGAERHAQAALGRLSAVGWGVAVGEPLAELVLARTGLGRHDQAAAVLRQRVPEAMFRTRYGLRLRYAAGRHHLATDRLHAALRDFVTCGSLLTGWGLDLPVLLPWRQDAARTLRRLGRPDSARLVLAGQPRTPASGTGHREPGSLRPVPAVPAVPAMPVVSAVPAVRAVPAVTREESDRLSEAELRVARLAAGGGTNREISRMLFITVSTVEQHLTRVYRKLRIAGRADLTARLAEQLATSA